MNGVDTFCTWLIKMIEVDFFIIGHAASLYRVRNKTVLQIGKGNPQQPQSFYSLASSVQIQQGDFVIGECVYNNNDDRIINNG